MTAQENFDILKFVAKIPIVGQVQPLKSCTLGTEIIPAT